MGCYDTVLVPCPKCGEKAEFQSKSSDCLLRTFELDRTPADVMEDVNRHAPATCPGCGTKFKVDFETLYVVLRAKSVVAPENEDGARSEACPEPN